MRSEIQFDNSLTGLLDAARRGDETACYAIYQHFAQPIFRLAYGILLDRLDAEEVVQDTFTYSFKNIAKYDPARSAFKTWLYTIAMSRCRNKRRRKWLPTITFSEAKDPHQATNELPEQRYAEQNTRDILLGALRKLSPKLREAVVLRYFEGLTFREMADVIGCPQKTAESRIRLAHNALYELLAENAETLLGREVLP